MGLADFGAVDVDGEAAFDYDEETVASVPLPHELIAGCARLLLHRVDDGVQLVRRQVVEDDRVQQPDETYASCKYIFGLWMGFKKMEARSVSFSRTLTTSSKAPDARVTPTLSHTNASLVGRWQPRRLDRDARRLALLENRNRVTRVLRRFYKKDAHAKSALSL